MSDLYSIYVETRAAMDRTSSDAYIFELNKNMMESLERADPTIKSRYERNKKVQESFTPEQIDFICYQIGDWYLEWKEKMATGEGKCHRLGVAKEYLKIKICGE